SFRRIIVPALPDSNTVYPARRQVVQLVCVFLFSGHSRTKIGHEEPYPVSTNRTISLSFRTKPKLKTVFSPFKVGGWCFLVYFPKTFSKIGRAVETHFISTFRYGTACSKKTDA